MNQISPTFLTTAFVPPGTLSLASCIEQVRECPDLSEERRRDLVSGLRRLAEALKLEPADVPADPKWLQPRIAAIAPAALGISAKSWANILSNARAGLIAAGVVAKAQRLSDLSPLWAPLWAGVLASGNIRVSRVLGRFVRCLDNLGVAPADVGRAEAELYRKALEVNDLHRSPEDSMRQAVRG